MYKYIQGKLDKILFDEVIEKKIRFQIFSKNLVKNFIFNKKAGLSITFYDVPSFKMCFSKKKIPFFL